MKYSVVVAKSGCCSPLSNRTIEEVCNDMAASGYVLIAAFPENINTCCCGQTERAVFLIFAHP